MWVHMWQVASSRLPMFARKFLCLCDCVYLHTTVFHVGIADTCLFLLDKCQNKLILGQKSQHVFVCTQQLSKWFLGDYLFIEAKNMTLNSIRSNFHISHSKYSISGKCFSSYSIHPFIEYSILIFVLVHMESSQNAVLFHSMMNMNKDLSLGHTTFVFSYSVIW